MVWRSHLLGHSQQHCTRSPQPPHTRAHTYAETDTHTAAHRRTDQACTERHTETHPCIQSLGETCTHAHETDPRTHAHTWCSSSELEGRC